jgi:hypothetical protein
LTPSFKASSLEEITTVFESLGSWSLKRIDNIKYLYFTKATLINRISF